MLLESALLKIIFKLTLLYFKHTTKFEAKIGDFATVRQNLRYVSERAATWTINLRKIVASDEANLILRTA